MTKMTIKTMQTECLVQVGVHQGSPNAALS